MNILSSIYVRIAIFLSPFIAIAFLSNIIANTPNNIIQLCSVVAIMCCVLLTGVTAPLSMMTKEEIIAKRIKK